MGDAVIVSTARTPIGTAFKGTLVDVDAFDARHPRGRPPRSSARASTRR